MMRYSIRDFVEICSETLIIGEPICEFGSFRVPGQEKFADLRPYFKGKKYIGADIRKGPGVDIILDLHKIDLPSDYAGTILIMDTLEHVEFIREAISEAHRILRTDGVLIISSVMNFVIHNRPDYWRFTPEGFKSLLKIFEISYVDFVGENNFPHTVIGVGFKNKKQEIEEFIKRINDWKQTWK